MTAYGYVRVSTKDQVDGYGLQVQNETVRALGNLAITIFFDEGVSGKLTDRPGLGEAVRTLRDGDVLVVPRLDRLARDLITQELLLREIRSKGADVVSCLAGENAYLAEDAGDPSRKLIRQILGAVAEYERSMISLRTQAGKRAKKAAGGYAGGQPPYGWTGQGGELVPVPEEQTILHVMQEAVIRGLSPFATATHLNLNGCSTRNGKDWTAAKVSKMLQRGTPAGAVGQDSRREVTSQIGHEVVPSSTVERHGSDHG